MHKAAYIMKCCSTAVVKYVNALQLTATANPDHLP